ncbi:hypothetical protein Tco_0431047 [Tanacetum coccineum]
MKVLVLCSSLRKAMFLWVKLSANVCISLNRSLVHTLHGKTYYELLKGKKPNLQYFRVFGSLCYPTNDYDDVGKLKAKADIALDELTKVDDLFQWFDDDEVIPPPAVLIPPVNAHAAQATENAIGSPSTTVISEGAPAMHLPSTLSMIDITPKQLPTVQKWTQAHSLETIIGDKGRTVLQDKA